MCIVYQTRLVGKDICAKPAIHVHTSSEARRTCSVTEEGTTEHTLITMRTQHRSHSNHHELRQSKASKPLVVIDHREFRVSPRLRGAFSHGSCINQSCPHLGLVSRLKGLLACNEL